jgi:Zn finger protein HypA/HybF involved in hydrogenase expression
MSQKTLKELIKPPFKRRSYNGVVDSERFLIGAVGWGEDFNNWGSHKEEVDMVYQFVVESLNEKWERDYGGLFVHPVGMFCRNCSQISMNENGCEMCKKYHLYLGGVSDDRFERLEECIKEYGVNSFRKNFIEPPLHEKDKRDFGEPLRWQISIEGGEAYITCPNCRREMIIGMIHLLEKINITKVLDSRWQYCPSCGKRIKPMEEK